MTGTFLFIALAFCREISAFSARPLQNQQLQTVSWLRKTKHRMHSSGFSHRYMAEMHDSFKYGETIASNINSVVGSSIAETSNKRTDISVSFSHIQLFVDHMESLEFYKAFEVQLNKLDAAERSSHLSTDGRRNLWVSLLGEEVEEKPFIPQNRDIVKQLMAGFGFRVTGYRLPSIENTANTKSLLITSLDSGGVQLVVSALADPSEGEPRDDFVHFDASYHHQFYRCHANRQGIAVLGFKTQNVEVIHERYQKYHPDLIHSCEEYVGLDGSITKVLQVFSYYEQTQENNHGMQPDRGTMLRFLQSDSDNTSASCALPGLTFMDAAFASSSQPAYCDHWVSNVYSRTGFWKTLEDVLDFSPKADFNAGVVAAGEAQIESTVIGNSSPFETTDEREALINQSQVYLPINNALSEVGHVHGFLKEIGQGIQHVASRVENLIEFIQRCNDMRTITGEGFSFLVIPRSYYGVLTIDHLISNATITADLARQVHRVCEEANIISSVGAVNLELSQSDLETLFQSYSFLNEEQKQSSFKAILNSRYSNLYTLLQDQITEDEYLGIVRNQILVDVQGSDILFQIFTCNVLQRNQGEEAPFLEFIQRVCSPSKTKDGSTNKIKPGCGGFGIRNFLTLFLSIEVSKAASEVTDAKRSGDDNSLLYAEKRVKYFTDQLNDSNPILTEISNAMTEEGECRFEMEAAIRRGDEADALMWKQRSELANQKKEKGNRKLMECSARYAHLMKGIREAVESSNMRPNTR